MSYVICGDCTNVTAKRYDAGVCNVVTKLHGSLRALFVKCGTTFTDILDTTEWGNKLSAASGTATVIVSPSYGKFAHDEGTANVLTNLGASLDVPDITDYTFTYETPATAANYDAVEDWYKSLYENHASYRLNWFDYDLNRIYTDNDTVETFRPNGTTATAPIAYTDAIGFVFSMTKPPLFAEGPNGFGRAGAWKLEGGFSTSHTLRSIEIPGIKAIVEANA